MNGEWGRILEAIVLPRYGRNSRELGGKLALSGRQCVEHRSLSLTCTVSQIYANDEQPWLKTYCIFTLRDTSLVTHSKGDEQRRRSRANEENLGKTATSTMGW